MAIAADTLQLVVFHLADELYGLEISDVREIITVPAITPIPRAPSFIEGVINLRGRVVPLIDLRACFGMPRAERNRSTRVIVASVGADTVGMVADAVSQVIAVARSEVTPPDPAVVDARTAYIRGIVRVEDKIVIWADLERLLTAQQQAESALLLAQHVG